jgi:hypothetical protein
MHVSLCKFHRNNKLVTGNLVYLTYLLLLFNSFSVHQFKRIPVPYTGKNLGRVTPKTAWVACSTESQHAGF